jgi:hypothetical protein
VPLQPAAFKRAGRLRLRRPGNSTQRVSRLRHIRNGVGATLRFVADPVLWILWSCLVVVAICVVSFVIPTLWPHTPFTYEQRDEQLRRAVDSTVGTDAPRGFASISVESLDAARHTARCNVAIRIEHGAARLVSATDGSLVYDAQGSLRKEFQGKSFTFQLMSIDAGWSERIPLSLDSAGDYRKAVILDVPAEVSPTRFPQDQWRFSVFGDLFAPEGIAFRDAATPGVQWDGVIPLAVTFIQAPQLEQWEMSVTGDVGIVSPAGVAEPPYWLGSLAPSQGWSSSAGSVMTRPFDVWLFVYAIAALPLILGGGYLFRQRRADRDSGAALSLAATLLSLLTLRQVVTPVDIQGITRLDRLLALELAVLIAAFAMTAILAPANQTEPGPVLTRPPRQRLPRPRLAKRRK